MIGRGWHLPASASNLVSELKSEYCIYIIARPLAVDSNRCTAAMLVNKV